MNIGLLDTRCRVEQKSVTQDDVYGAEVIVWVLLGVRWCAIQDVLPSRSESVNNDLSVSLNKSRLRMRYCTDIDSSMRIVINRPTETIFQIISGPAILGNKDGVEFMIERISSE